MKIFFCFRMFIILFQEAKNLLKNKPENVEYKLVCIGDKSKAGLARLYGNNILYTANEIGRLPPTFEDASIAALEILNSGYEFDEVVLFFTM